MKSCAIRFGREFILWQLGLEYSFSDKFIEKAKKRIMDGMVAKCLGHEFVSPESPDMKKYIDLFSFVKKHDSADGPDPFDGIISQFNGAFKIEDLDDKIGE